MVTMSDHGTYDYPYEIELTNHGYQDFNNTAFVHFMSPKFKGKKLAQSEVMHISQFAGSFCLFMKNCNIPILSTHTPKVRFQGDLIEELIAMRSREIQ